LIPDVALKYKYEVEDEEGIYEGDVILLTIELIRGAKPPPEGEEEPEQDKKTISTRHKSFEERLDDLPMTPKSKIRATLVGESYPIHSLRYPFPKQEKWFIYLVEHVKKHCDRCNTNIAAIFCQNCNAAFCPNCDQKNPFQQSG